MVICLERGADLHMAQLMPLPLTVSCFSKIQIGFTFLVRLTWVVLDKGPLSGCMYVCMFHVCRTQQISTASRYAAPPAVERYLLHAPELGSKRDVRRCCSVDRTRHAVDRRDRQTDGRTPDRCCTRPSSAANETYVAAARSIEHGMLSIDGTDRQTDGRTPDRYTDPAPHTTTAGTSVAERQQQTTAARSKATSTRRNATATTHAHTVSHNLHGVSPYLSTRPKSTTLV